MDRLTDWLSITLVVDWAVKAHYKNNTPKTKQNKKQDHFHVLSALMFGHECAIVQQQDSHTLSALMVMGWVFEDNFFGLHVEKMHFPILSQQKTMIPTNLEEGEVGGGRPLQLCRWTYFAKSKSKRVIARKRPNFNKKINFSVLKCPNNEPMLVGYTAYWADTKVIPVGDCKYAARNGCKLIAD